MAKTFGMKITGIDKAMKNLAALGPAAAQGGAIMLKNFADTRIVTPAKEEYAPVVSGNLRSTIRSHEPMVHGSRFSVLVSAGGSAAKYALCVGSRMHVAVNNNGSKQISSVRVGDKVLTQAGVWKPVKKVFRYDVEDGTPILRIVAAWRNGKSHTLEVTENHEIMVFRDGKNQWIKAGDLNIGDKLYRRKKIVHNVGRSIKTASNCLWCSNQFYQYPNRKLQNNKWCSCSCYWNWRSRPGNNKLSGLKRLPEVTAKMSASMILRHQREPEKHPLRVLARKGHKSSHIDELERWLDAMGIPYEREVRIGNRFVDFLCPTINRIIEADGSRWHRDQEKDIARDKYIMDQLGYGWEIVHIHYFEARYSPVNMQVNPLPNVYYVAVNPGPKTYVEPSLFDISEISDIKRTIYKLNGGNRKQVYDLEVADIQSYTVSGLLVHNSVHENPRSGKTGGVSPSGKKYYPRPGYPVPYSQVGQWKYLETPARIAASNSSRWLLAEAAAIMESIKRRVRI